MKPAPSSATKPPPDLERLQPLLFPLHAATETEALWRAVLALLREAFRPCARVTLYLGHFDMREARLVLTDPPIRQTPEWYKERGSINPFSPFIAAHRRITHYVFADVLGPAAKFRATDFYKRFARVEGWDKGVSAIFWGGTEVKSMFSVYRAPGHPAFTRPEIARLLHLRPHIETAIDRVQLLHSERLHRRVLEEFNRHIPVGLVLLDWELRPVFTNTEGLKECAVWCHGANVPRGLISRERFELPAPLRAACEHIRAAIQRSNAKDNPKFARRVQRLNHAELPGRLASLSAVHASPGLLAKPGFLVVLEDRSRGQRAVARLPVSQKRLLWVLTPCEREIALLVREGCTNREIAHRLKKSVLTVKKQLTSVFAKLRVPSRARVTALLR